jgi:hypothetical protein
MIGRNTKTSNQPPTVQILRPLKNAQFCLPR